MYQIILLWKHSEARVVCLAQRVCNTLGPGPSTSKARRRDPSQMYMYKGEKKVYYILIWYKIITNGFGEKKRGGGEKRKSKGDGGATFMSCLASSSKCTAIGWDCCNSALCSLSPSPTRSLLELLSTTAASRLATALASSAWLFQFTLLEFVILHSPSPMASTKNIHHYNRIAKHWNSWTDTTKLKNIHKRRR